MRRISLKVLVLALAVVAASVIDAQQRFRFRQAPGCSYDIAPTSESAPAAGETDIGVVAVDTQAGCEWTATSNAAWITVTSTTGGGSSSGPLVGAIRFNLWDHSIPDNVEGNLNTLETDASMRDRLPYFSVITSPTTATVNEGTQAVVDQDILHASNAGIDFWIMGSACSYNDYVIEKMATSPYRHLIKFASSQSATLTCRVDKLISELRDPQYLTVLGGRPVIFFFMESYAESDSPDDVAATAAHVTSLRARVMAETGRPNPYLVAWSFAAGSAASYASALGMDAISAYGGGLSGPGLSGTIPYSTLVANEVSDWTAYKNTGRQYHPTVTTGWDDLTGLFQTTEATPSEIATHLQNALTFNATNPSSNIANFLVLSAWNEFTEGHFLTPFHSATNAVGTGRLDAIGAVLDDESDTGDGTVIMTVAANTGSARSGTVTIAGQTFTVNQAAAASGGGTLISEGDIDWNCPGAPERLTCARGP